MTGSIDEVGIEGGNAGSVEDQQIPVAEQVGPEEMVDPIVTAEEMEAAKIQAQEAVAEGLKVEGESANTPEAQVDSSQQEREEEQRAERALVEAKKTQEEADVERLASLRKSIEVGAEEPQELVPDKEGARGIGRIRIEIGAPAYAGGGLGGVEASRIEKKYTLCPKCGGTGRRLFIFGCGVCKGTGRVIASESASQTRSV